MCGIFGLSLNEKSDFSPKQIESVIKDLFLLSESRGKEAAGLAVLREDKIEVFKSAVSASAMIRTKKYEDLLRGTLADEFRDKDIKVSEPLTFIGHSRLTTTGTQYYHKNNQPVITGRSVGIHNGIVVNTNSIWQRYSQLEQKYQVDSEVIFSLIRMFYDEGSTLIEAVQKTFSTIEGMASVAILFEDMNILLLATNNGSLYRCSDSKHSTFIFASERYILNQLQKRNHISRFSEDYTIQKIFPGQGCIINTCDLSFEEFSLYEESGASAKDFRHTVQRKIIELEGVQQKGKELTAAQKQVGLVNTKDGQMEKYLEQIKKRFPHNSSWQDSLRRCAKCILPETMPFIEFDEEGVCNYCHNHNKLVFRGIEALKKIADKHRSHNGDPDCVVGISGGRDSLYSLHCIKNIVGLNPVAYTYDWAMVTDLARRNISRICGKLGIEHVLVSADITKKRRYIKQNVSAWLKKPSLGMIPLFMAGDKQYFYYLSKVRKQIGVELAILGENMLERTDFKTGFASAPPHWDEKHVYTLPLWSKIKIASFYGKNYLLNPSYINTSLFDTIFAAASYYVIDRNYLNLYNYIPWIEDEVNSTLINEYDFELAPDTSSTWRIGDGTAAFYNYIYYNVAGFTENDTFRSNQIREGSITRNKALELVREESKPRYETINNYLNLIEMDIGMDEVLEIIHAIPRLRP